jgi:hypothetical protein
MTNRRFAEEWDFESSEARAPVKARRTVVSVSFPIEDFQVVARHAEAFGFKVSEFIRQAALEKTRGSREEPTVHLGGGGTAVVLLVDAIDNASTKAESAEELVEQPELAFTS